MSRLNDSLARLERAVGRLEQALGPDGAPLNEELSEVRARCEALEERARTVSDRLDLTIGRVKAMLEE